MLCTGSKRALGKASWRRRLWCEALMVRGLEVGAPAEGLHSLCQPPQLCLPEGPRGLTSFVFCIKAQPHAGGAALLSPGLTGVLGTAGTSLPS